MKRLSEIGKAHPFAGCLLAVTLLCAPFFCMEYATDTYTVACVGMGAFSRLMYQNGRLIPAALLALFHCFSWSIEAFYYTSFVLSVLFAAMAVWRLYRVLQHKVAPAAAAFFAFFTVLNPIAIEYFLFLEKGCFLFGIFMSVVALEQYVKALRGSRIGWLWSVLALTVSAFVYQPLPGVFAVLAVAFAILYADDRWGCFALYLGAAVGIYGVGCGANALFTKFVGESQRAGSLQLSNLVRGLVAFGVLPACLLYGGVLLLLAVVCAVAVKRRGGKLFGRESGILFVKSAFCFLAAVTVTVLPFLFTDPNEIWMPFRIMYPMSMALGSIPLLFWYRPHAQTSSSPRTSRAACSVFAVLLVLLFLFFQTVMIGRLINNATDERLCRTIGAEIEAYESRTGERVTQVAIYHDASVTRSNPWVLPIGDGNVRAFYKDWSDVDHMCVILERPFIEVPPDGTVYTAYFAGQNWDAFAPEQLVFTGNTLHLCIY